MKSNTGLAWDRVGKVLLIVHAPHAPTDAEWDELLGSQEASAPDGMIVVSNGIKPSPRQRGQIQEHFGAANTAVLTDSVVTRGAITALSWFAMPIRAFAPKDIQEALEFARVPASDQALVRRRLEELNSRVAAA